LTDYENLTGYSQSLAELDKTATKVSRNYFYGSELLVQRSGETDFLNPENPANDELAFVLTDHLGSSRLLTDVGGGIYGDSYDTSAMDFSPYGEFLGGTSSLTSYRFTGQYFDSLLALQYHRARWLNPSLANWLSADPVFDFPGNFGNSYSYGSLNPVNVMDPSGLFTIAEAITVNSIVNDIINLEFWIGEGAKQAALIVVAGISLKEAFQVLLITAVISVVAIVGIALAGRVISRLFTAARSRQLVWDYIEIGAKGYWPGTKIPMEFAIQAGGRRFWVTPSASKHLKEFFEGAYSASPAMAKACYGDPDLVSQILLTDLQCSIEEAIKRGGKTGTDGIFVAQVDAIRRQTYTGRPLGTDSLIARLETIAGRILRALPRGRQKRRNNTVCPYLY
jgi:RHS repeat-associated protein